MKLSFKSRLLAGFAVAAYLPFLLLLAYIDYTNRQVLVNKISTRQAAMLENIKQSIEIDVEQLEREGRFIASLGIMNDLVISDADKRIQKLLELKKATLKLDANLWAVDSMERCIASTDGCGSPDSSALRIVSAVRSRYADQPVGQLVIALPLQTFAQYFPKQSDARWSITHHAKTVASSATPIEASRENIHIHEPFGLPIMQGFSLHVLIQRSAVVASFGDIRLQTALFALAGLLLIVAMAHYLSRYFSEPLKRMSNLMQKIVKAGSYELRSNIVRSDEIGMLSHSIDTLLQTTQTLLNALGEESKNRLQRFTALIDIFNAISRSNDEAEIDRLVKKCLSDDFFEQEPEQYDRFIEAVIRMARLQKERLLLQKTQLRLLEETSEALKTKSAFISQISHEFRTPLNSIIGFSQFMDQEKLLQPPYEKLPKNVEKAGKYLLEMINQLLELAKSESVSLQTAVRTLDLVQIGAEVVELVTPLAQKNRTKLTYDKPSNPCLVEADERMMRQVLFNLLGNAIKFSPEAEVSFQIVCQDTQQVVITIRDTGIGMAKGEIEKIFTPFQRLSNSLEFKGTGLGLSLAKAYVENFGGSIKASSEGIGKGSLFTVHLPRSTEEEG